MIQAFKPEARIMRHELTDFEWAAIRPFLPNKPRGIPRVDDRRVLNGIFWVLAVYFKCQISANYVCQKSAKPPYAPSGTQCMRKSLRLWGLSVSESCSYSAIWKGPFVVAERPRRTA